MTFTSTLKIQLTSLALPKLLLITVTIFAVNTFSSHCFGISCSMFYAFNNGSTFSGQLHVLCNLLRIQQTIYAGTVASGEGNFLQGNRGLWRMTDCCCIISSYYIKHDASNQNLLTCFIQLNVTCHININVQFACITLQRFMQVTMGMMGCHLVHDTQQQLFRFMQLWFCHLNKETGVHNCNLDSSNSVWTNPTMYIQSATHSI